MAKYLLEATYTVSGAQGLMGEGGSSRREAVTQLVESLGGTVEAFYFAFGDSDFVLIADFPDSASAVAASLTAGAAGGDRGEDNGADHGGGSGRGCAEAGLVQGAGRLIVAPVGDKTPFLACPRVREQRRDA